MELGIFDFEALEVYEAENRLTPDRQPPADRVVLGHSERPTWQVWFRDEYFGTVPGELIPDIALIMAEAGGLEYDPVNRRLEAWHEAGAYHAMVTGIVARLNRWMLENNITDASVVLSATSK